MEMKEVLLFLTDQWADWEASHAIAGINAAPQYVVKTIAIDKQPKVSIGGLRAEIDYEIDEYENFDNLAMVILTGSFSWGESRHDKVAEFVKKVIDLRTPIAAICGATIFLGKHGFLNDIKHTGDIWEYFQENLENEKGYTGAKHFVSAQLVNDNGIITANETASIDFAREIFRTLSVYPSEEIDVWYDYFTL